MTDMNKINRLRRNRYRLSKKSKSDCRLSVFRSNKHIYAQVIDDKNHKTLFSSSTHDSDLKLKTGSTKESAFKVGEKIALIAKEKGFKNKITFDRGTYKYHGRIKELAEGARSKGLKKYRKI